MLMRDLAVPRVPHRKPPFGVGEETGRTFGAALD
jgi:hypothetical protein